MMNFKIVIRSKPKRKDGKVNVKIRVIFNNEARDIGTEYYVFPPKQFFDMKTGTIKAGGGYTQEEADRANNRLKIKVAQMIEKASKRNLRYANMKSLIEILRDKHHDMDFFAVIDNRIEEYEKAGNRNYAMSMRTTKNLVMGFVGGEILPFERIDYSWLKRLERSWTVGPSSVGFYMRNIRTIWNEGRKLGLVDPGFYPFINYSIPKGRRRHIALTTIEVATIGKKEIHEPLMKWARDMAMLSFCLIGINMKDLAYLEKIEGGRMNYVRSKGKKPYSIKVPPQALHIINRYPGKKYLLNILDNYADYRSASKRINYKLKDIAELCEIKKEVSTYSFRHSWGTIARQIGISKDDISAALGHRRIEIPEVTEGYIEEDQLAVDIANKKVVRFILRTPPSG